jgi:hypothetical protein
MPGAAGLLLTQAQRLKIKPNAGARRHSLERPVEKVIAGSITGNDFSHC